MFRLVLKSGDVASAPKSLVSRLGLFKSHPDLLNGDTYAVACDVRRSVLDMLVLRLYGAASEDQVTPENAEQLKALCAELGFSGFDGELGCVFRGDSAAEASHEPPVHIISEKDLVIRRGVFVFNPSRPLDGIITRMQEMRERRVLVTASSSLTPGGPSRLLIAQDPMIFMSKKEPNSWICYDFKGQHVSPTSYSIWEGGYGLKSWVLEASNDGSSWLVLDCRENTEYFQDRPRGDLIGNFAINPAPRESFRYLRLRQTGKTHEGEDCLAIRYLEFYGTLFDE